MTEHPDETTNPTGLVDDLIDETRGPEEDPPADSTTDDAAEFVASGPGEDEGVPETPEPPD
ncbi:hypothetical protein Kfla_0698 [Kribbella flavida DSM 17836]|uniref:Uncharacterized protein n=1 Tax=Kribbella flavida (strain DSM 17836 / JCM 10339 / NBRC 14399) TaxID=479435 RepID=D2PXH1_KRIFD|nr:hypothetical protein [Kribbella flavida]ADB29819.1 hypothetical protein Kfla_0698 [Kribbella flavida DSM 17836]